MRECPSEYEFVQLLSGELPAEVQSMLRAHLRTCAACGTTWAQMQTVWDALDTLHTLPEDIDLAPAVIAEAIRADAHPSAVTNWARPLGLAASIALVTGLGILAGKSVPLSMKGMQPRIPVTNVAMATHLGIPVFGIESATGLSLGFGESIVPSEVDDE